MSNPLTISIGQHSDRGHKDINQDFHGACVPQGHQLTTKGILVALADGISSSTVSQVASESAVRNLLSDYYCTSDAWSVKHAVQCVLSAINAWLYAQTRSSQYRYDQDKGYVCTLSALVIKSSQVHLFHVGDTRIYRLSGQSLEQLTEDHRVSIHTAQSYLSRALGIGPQIEIDYLSMPVEEGDIFLLASDGVYEYMDAQCISAAIAANTHDLDAAAQQIVAAALERGSQDNLTLQIVRIDHLDHRQPRPFLPSSILPAPPMLEARMEFDGYHIVRELHHSHRSHLYLAIDNDSGQQVALKTPSTDLSADVAQLNRFALEEWVARRINHAHVLKPCQRQRKPQYIYVAMEFIEGITLAQWMRDNPRPDLETVRGIIEQVAKGLQAFHRAEMLHQDLRPENIMIDRHGIVKIVDFGSVWVAGLEECDFTEISPVPGTIQYMAPEYFLAGAGSPLSDQFSLGVIAYQMLTGKLPYGAQVARIKTGAQLQRLPYISAIHRHENIPSWIDDALAKAVHLEAEKRYPALSEFIHDLRHPNRKFLNRHQGGLLEKNPLLFWKTTSLLLLLLVIILLYIIQRS
ncbi:Serine/threonine protein phosphatase PrpC [Methylobacillus rhizosphaerae]|uniref:Serine/threonine protein phosphatase PrpC n=1 Tax=Methylobacillus rhizosphaerae TaxID=551994 RepID=A0A239A5S5_9PROT|nr:bifunctional protein-serine/threonine kinase/phosphatase [Methylobacillus rhizosphaerae]SNR90782.1 Serine/threonine protein phosphatase PrpC [Methylobacillus rhizosphaerae]